MRIIRLVFGTAELGYYFALFDHSCISMLDIICHLQTPGRIILAMFLNVKCVHHHHHSYQV